MREAFTFLYSRLFIESLLIVGIVALVLGRLRRRLRVAPDQATRAPLLWLVNFTADARLHRRLRRLASKIRGTVRTGGSRRRRRTQTQTQRLASDIESALIDLDERLIGSTALDFDGQRSEVRAIRGDADRIDSLIDRTDALIRREADDPAVQITQTSITELSERLDQLEAKANADTAKVIETTADRPHALDTAAIESAT